jgi:hypothetical protein
MPPNATAAAATFLSRILWLALLLAVCGMSLMAQTPSTSTNAAQQVHADLNQLMRGVLYPAANVVFSAQADNPDEVAKTRGGDPSMATDPLMAAFGGWQAVQNAALALAESANLMMIEGRRCANGAPVPTNDPAWATFVQDLRDASMKAYVAAQAKDQEKILDVSETLSANCAGCHRRWRDRRRADSRCK